LIHRSGARHDRPSRRRRPESGEAPALARVRPGRRGPQ
jgi:hypothetical protein